MSWFKSKQQQLAENLRDELVYAQVAGEIANNDMWPGLWAKAFAEAQGNEQQAEATYIKLRAKQIKLQVGAVGEFVRQVEQLPPLSEAALPQPPKRPSGAYYQCAKCQGWDVNPPDLVSGQAAYCRDCNTFLYKNDSVWHAP